jgi:hypothetical protein
MNDDGAQPSTLAPATEAEPLVCPNCGYDLRGATAERCSECGHVVDASTLLTSGYPWVHRRHRGRIRTYLHTVWLVTVGSRRIAHEAARPQREADGLAFRRVTAAFVALGFIGIFVTAVAAANIASDDGFSLLAVQPADISGMRPTERWLQDVLVPLSAAATLPPALPILLVGLAFALTAAHQRLFRLTNASPQRQQRANAIAGYAVAPLFWLFPTLAWGCVMVTLAIRPDGDDPVYGWVAFWTLAAASLLVTVVRITQASMRVRFTGLERVVIDTPQLLALWLWNVVLYLFILPWCIGLVWIIIDSFL